MDIFEEQHQAIDEYPGGLVAYISDSLVRDNTRDPITGKYMLQSFGELNVGVLFVRFIQLCALKRQDPAKYSHINFSTARRQAYRNCTRKYSISITLRNPETHYIDDLPDTVELYAQKHKIVMWWSLENRADGLYRLVLREDSGLITAYFREKDGSVIKSSDGRVEYHSSNQSGYLIHRPQEDGPAVITTEGDHEYWENGIHIRTEEGGCYIKG